MGDNNNTSKARTCQELYDAVLRLEQSLDERLSQGDLKDKDVAETVKALVEYEKEIVSRTLEDKKLLDDVEKEAQELERGIKVSHERILTVEERIVQIAQWQERVEHQLSEVYSALGRLNALISENQQALVKRLNANDADHKELKKRQERLEYLVYALLVFEIIRLLWR
jgi:predicted  nucleic acid-binding Zn-ribbon protein